MARLTTIRLYGVLGARFGRVHKLAVQTSAEAVKRCASTSTGWKTI
jgi:predicted phage tail protein